MHIEKAGARQVSIKVVMVQTSNSAMYLCTYKNMFLNSLQAKSKITKMPKRCTIFFREIPTGTYPSRYETTNVFVITHTLQVVI